jgi:urea carboxylase-associated protein 2
MANDTMERTMPGVAVPSSAVHAETLRGGQMWSRVLKRGQTLTLTDLEGGAAVAALFYNAHDRTERYNMPDTLKAQFIARLTRGDVLYSDMGRILCSVVADSCGWHDTITGHADAAWTEKRFGKGSYQELRNDFHRNTHENFLTELGKYELGKRDIVANVNFFVKVSVADDGSLVLAQNHSKPGSSVTLRAELHTLVVLSNTPHPLDPSPRYAPTAVHLSVGEGHPAGPNDECRLKCPQNGRGFALTEDYFA